MQSLGYQDLDIGNIIGLLLIDNLHIIPGLGTFENSRRTLHWRGQMTELKEISANIKSFKIYKLTTIFIDTS